MTHFHVFLPPPVTSRTGDVSSPSIRFLKLHPTLSEFSEESASQKLRGLISPGTTSRGRLRDQGEKDTTISLGVRTDEEVKGRTSEGVFPHLVPRNEGNTSRRRSRRLERVNESLLGTLPQLGMDSTRNDLSDSYSSLNTTGTNFSQLPPTALGNEPLTHLPTWRVQLNKLDSLSSLMNRPSKRKRSTYLTKQDKMTVSVIVCVMAVEQPVLRQRKEEKRKGEPGSLWIGSWKVTAPPEGDEEAVSCTVKLWEECARDWGDDKVRKGDVVLLENVDFVPVTSRDGAQLILSPTPNYVPTPVILYRTLPRYAGAPTKANYIQMIDHRSASGNMMAEDRALRPDLRVGRSDAGVRRIAEIAKWFAEWVNGNGPV